MNYYQTPEFLNSTAERNSNNHPNTILPYLAYNDYEQEMIKYFTACANDKYELDHIIYCCHIQQRQDESNDDINDPPVNDDSNDENESSPSPAIIDEVIDESTNESPLSPGMNATINVSPLPPLTQPTTDPQTPSIHFIMTHLESIASKTEQLDSFLEYIEEKYGIDLTQPFDDLPFDVIDEILTFLNYDPDEKDDEPLDFNMFQCERIIISRELITSFQNHLNSFVFNVKTLQHLDNMNGITDSRTDDSYYAFQTLFKPSITTLVQLYKHSIKHYKRVLSESMDYYITQDSFDFEYSDHDW